MTYIPLIQHTRSDKGWITEYCRLSVSTYTYLSSYRQFFGTWAVQLIRGVFHLDISFLYFSGSTRFTSVFCSLHNWSWQSRRQGIMRYTNGWCTDTLATMLNKSLRYCLFQWWSFLLIISKTCNFAVTKHYLSLSWGSWIHFTPAILRSIFNITVLPTYLCLKSSKGLFHSGFPTKTWYTCLFPPMCATCPICMILTDFIIIIQ